ncbi:hypothetical protein PUN28_019678 [Cardiocondyla obscurior]|uniref:Uncharacterized protein n=1 Tax=Cardiocondyla obscurior TaxID=286306 RepID=A0AAW2EA03_9HYME
MIEAEAREAKMNAEGKEDATYEGDASDQRELQLMGKTMNLTKDARQLRVEVHERAIYVVQTKAIKSGNTMRRTDGRRNWSAASLSNTCSRRRQAKRCSFLLRATKRDRGLLVRALRHRHLSTATRNRCTDISRKKRSQASHAKIRPAISTSQATTSLFLSSLTASFSVRTRGKTLSWSSYARPVLRGQILFRKGPTPSALTILNQKRSRDSFCS